MSQHNPIKTFVCYARQDREVVDAVKDQLAIFEKQGLLKVWFDGQIQPGEEWDKVIKKHLAEAQLILLFVSVDFINSEYIEKTELQMAFQRHRDGLATLIPIIVRQCHWKKYFEIGKFQALPKNGNPIRSAHFRDCPDDAYFEVSGGVEAAAEQWCTKNAKAAAEQATAAEKAQEQEIQRQQRRAATQRQQDEAAWQTAVAAAQAATIEREKIAAYEVYLDDHTLHAAEATQAITDLKTAETARKIAEKTAQVKQSGPPDRFVLVKGGTFQMGDVMGDKEKGDEQVHTVTVDDFFLARHALTFAEYDAFCEATKREKPSDEGWGRGQRPAINVSWYDAVAYCNWRSQQEGRRPAYTIEGEQVSHNSGTNGYRLPTEAEWEYAAREGGKKVRFGNGRDVIDPSEINFDASAGKKPYSIAGEYRRKTVPVNELSTNALGLQQMSGNVLEWCWDWYGEKFYTESDGARNPRGPSGGANRVLRGGSWGRSPQSCRAANRGYYSPTGRDDLVGFRLASSLQ